MPGNANFDTLLSTTLLNYRPTLVDNIFTARVLLDHLNSAGRVVVETGGTQIIEPLVYAQNGTVGSYAGYDAIDLTPQEGITAAEYDFKQMAASIAISGIEEAKNRGPEAIIKLLQAKIMQAEESIKENLNDMLFGDGTGNGGKDFNGLANIIDATGTVGNINASGNSWWASYEENTSTALTTAQMATAYNTASRGNDHPDLILTTQTLFEKYESLLTPQVRYQDTTKANLGFQNLMFKQTPVVYDVSAPSGNMFFMNSKYLKLVGMADHWFETTEFQKGTVAGVDARYALILSFGNLTCSNRARQAKLTAKTA
jgi:hypothetical protein